MNPPQAPHQSLPRAPIHEAATLHRAGRVAEALALYRKILKKNPRDPDALHLAGVALAQQGDIRGGLESIGRAVQVRDDFPDAHVNAAQFAAQLGDFDLAERHAKRAAAHRPNAATYTNVGRLLRAQDKYEEALAAFKAAHTCNPRDPEGHISYARALRMTGDLGTMLAVAQEGLRLAPNHPTLQLLASEALFGLGRLNEGWHAYRHRFRSVETPAPVKPYGLPLWQGENLANQSVLIWAEQGPGDEIMYASMYADVLARAKRTVIQCSPRLAPLIRRSFPSAEIFDRDLTSQELAGLTYQTPAGSMGEWLRASLASFPSATGYLEANADLRASLRARYLGEKKDHLLVGLAWRSANTNNASDKSLNILDWGPILNVPGVTFVNLQYGDVALELGEAARGFKVPIIQDATIDPLKDMDSYAAQVAAMDFVVSSSNTAVHVAGALGIPGVCMLPTSLDHGRRWYWLADGDRTPWYPSLRLLIQRQPGEWLNIVREAGLALLDAAAAGRDIPKADYYRKMLSAFASMKRPADAEAVCEHMARDPALAAEAYLNIADMRRRALDAEGVFAACDKAIAADPAYWAAYNLKGATLADLHRFEEAIAVCKQGLQHNARSHLLHSHLGQALHNLGRYAEALHHTRLAIEFAPPEKASAVDGLSLNCASLLYDSGHPSQALEMVEALIARAPDHVDARYNRGLYHLAHERWAEGWRDFRQRLKRPNAVVRHDLFPHVKPWDDEPFAGKKILVWAEHGIGDEIIASTMLPDAIATARKTVILCTDRLVPIFQRSFPAATVDALKLPLPACAMASDFDFQVPIWDLGLAFRRTTADFPRRPSVLVPDLRRSADLRRGYQAHRPGNLLVGISWASPINQEVGWLKASRLETWRPILEVPGVTFVNLQYGDQSAALARVRDEMGIEVLNDPSIDPLKDMDAFAAQVAAMDLVISTSNTLAHTAGAIGIPTWILIAKGRGLFWYWLRDRSDSPWYSSVRLIRQEVAGDWAHPFEQCARDLSQAVQKAKEVGAS